MLELNTIIMHYHMHTPYYHAILSSCATTTIKFDSIWPFCIFFGHASLYYIHVHFFSSSVSSLLSACDPVRRQTVTLISTCTMYLQIFKSKKQEPDT
jgi:hypothetical protein